MEVSSWINFTLKHTVENVHGIININLNFLKGDFYVLVWLFCSLLIGECFAKLLFLILNMLYRSFEIIEIDPDKSRPNISPMIQDCQYTFTL